MAPVDLADESLEWTVRWARHDPDKMRLRRVGLQATRTMATLSSHRLPDTSHGTRHFSSGSIRDTDVNTPMIPLTSRIVALPVVNAIVPLGCTLGCALLAIFATSSVLGPVRWVGYLPSTLIGAYFGVFAAWTILGAILRVIAAVNGAPFQKGDIVHVLSGKHKGVKGKVEEPRVAHHGAYGSIFVDVDGELTGYGEFDLFLIGRINGEAPDDSL